ncbi:MAG: MFS transporter [Myxococcales bacterium FL481]|nr:MAG: MFS transporter [Myxococcales bacterium FL481]
MNRAQIVHENFTRRVRAGDLPPSVSGLTLADTRLSAVELVDLFESQVISRHLDLASRKLAANRESYYTIGSSGHEGNAVFGKVSRVSDMAFLHYRSCAFVVQRSKQVPGQTPIYDTMLSFVASSHDPISAGRHKVLGSLPLNIPPQTSTIASHLPKAMGAAYAIGLAERLGADAAVPKDGLIVCNFGDASANHSTAQGAINTAGWAAYQHSPMPIVFICEDNGIGISTGTPSGWIRASFEGRAGLRYFYGSGLDLLDAHRVASEAMEYTRRTRRPAFVHCQTVRLMGHAGSDTEVAYRDVAQIEATEGQDPLLHSARILIENEVLDAEQVCDLYHGVEQRVARVAQQAVRQPKLPDAAAVMASIVPKRGAYPYPPAPPAHREKLFASDRRVLAQPQHMARHISLALSDIMLQYPNTVVCGEDVGKKGGVYGATSGLFAKFGPARVVNTLLDEQSILGLAIGLAHNGLLPIPEIQFLAYVHNAEDQIRGEAATLSFFSNGQYTNPMVVRIAGLAYQKGFGGHFHNDNSFNVFRDLPGVVVACPSQGRDAAKMLRTCTAMAHEEGRVVIFLEPIALYMTRDLYEPGDKQWESVYEPPGEGTEIRFGEIGVEGDGEDLCILSYANGYYLSLQAAKRLEQAGVRCRVVDLRWLVPLNAEAIVDAVEPCAHVLVVDECRRTGSVSEELITLLVERGVHAPLARVCAEDSFIPLAAAANLVLPSVSSIVDAALALTGRKTSRA